MSDPYENLEFELAMPFLATISNGGTLDDAAYVAGVELGDMMNQIAVMGAGPLDRAVHPQNVSTIDLLAMRHGLLMEVVPSYMVDTTPEQRDEWAWVRLTRPAVEAHR